MRDLRSYHILPLARTVFGALLLCLWVFRAQSQVVIHEIMYHPAPAIPEDTSREWLELYNKGTLPARIDGWRFERGIGFTFTNAEIPPKAFLVVAANVTAFRAAYPEITNVVGGWSGKLANDGEQLELVDATGRTVDALAYSNEGDWGLRRPGLGYPGQPTWWPGWDWQSAADGAGSSLELIDSNLPGQSGQNWAASATPGGTPGRPNSVAASNTAPLILEMTHAPAVPNSTETVWVTARLASQAPPVIAEVVYRPDLPGEEFAAVAMFDDGLHGDGAPNDGLFGAVLPMQPDKTVVEFYARAQDATGKTRTWPSPTDASGTQGANALYQVDDFSYAGTQPLYRFIVKASEWNAWLNLMDYVGGGQFSDAQMNVSLVAADGTGTAVRYLAGLRNRGAGTRAARPHNLHLSVPRDRPLRGTTRINFNTRFVHSQTAGNAFFAAANVLNARGAPVQVRINSANLANAAPTGSNNSYQFGSYYRFEPYDSEWAESHIPSDSGGNIYKGVSYLDGVRLVHAADLEYLGSDPLPYQTQYSPTGPTSSTGPYSKGSNSSEDDWSDLINLTYALGDETTNYFSQVSALADTDQWLRYFALSSLLLTMETTLATGTGDDYSMYRGILDPRFRILNHDMDTVLGQGDTTPSWTRSIWKAAELPVVSRFLKHDDIAPRYLAILKSMTESVFAQPAAEGLLDQTLKGWVPDSYIQSMKDAVHRRRTNVLSQIPLTFAVFSTLPSSNGFFYTTRSTAALVGTADATRTHSIRVNGLAATYIPWQGTWSQPSVPLNPGVNRVRVEYLNPSDSILTTREIEIWFDTGYTSQTSGVINGNVTWRAADGPFLVTSPISVAAGATLTIEPGTTIYLAAGASIRVETGGRLIVQGSQSAKVRFMPEPGSTERWESIVLNGSDDSPENRITHALFEGNAGTCIQVNGAALSLEHSNFGSTTSTYVELHAASFLIDDCVFPATSAEVELVKGTGGIRPHGRGIVRGCYFGSSVGDADVFAFSGGRRNTGGPILEFVQNACSGAGDDILQLQGADAWIEGNIFVNAHRTGLAGTTAAVSAEADSTGTPSAPTLLRNLFFDCDHALSLNGGSFAALAHNSIARITNSAGFRSGLIELATNSATGAFLADNIIAEAAHLVRSYDPSRNLVTFRNNLLPQTWTGPGSGNRTDPPLFKHLPEKAQFGSWSEAQALWDSFTPAPGSAALGSGEHGSILGAATPSGVSLSDEPPALTALNSATLTVGFRHAGDGIPPSGYPLGSGYTHYHWRLNGGPWSPETPLSEPIRLTGLANGTYQVDVAGKRDSGSYQDDPDFPYGRSTSQSRAWTVETNLLGLKITEVLARNILTLQTNGDTPDLIELHNAGNQPVTLSGKGLTDDPSVKYKLRFPAGTVLQPGAYLVLFAGAGTEMPFTGFGLSQSGDALYLYDSADRGGVLLDSVEFSLQLPDYSIGRGLSEEWTLCKPSFGAANVPVALGDPAHLRINEWLVIPGPASPESFVELYNAGPAPVHLGGLFLTDAPDGTPYRHPLAHLGFIASRGHAVFFADGREDSGPSHLNFELDSDGGALGLSGPERIDSVVFGPQQSGRSEGRSPSGSSLQEFFVTPTPGSGNPAPSGSGITTRVIAYPLVTLTNEWRFYADDTEPAGQWQTAAYADGDWGTGSGLFGHETSNPYPYPHPITTPLPMDTSSGSAIITYYFRTTLVVPTNLTGFLIETAAYVDDGAVFYLDGTRIADLRVDQNPAAYGDRADSQPDEGVAESVDWGSVLLQPGTHLLAVEVHQSSSTSSDVVFGLQVTARRTVFETNYNRVLLTEVFANPASPGAVDFVEIYNPSAVPFELAGFSLTDDPLTPARWTFPAGIVLNPGTFLVINCDADKPASTTSTGPLNAGFGLSAAGDAVYLFDSNGALLDSLLFGAQAADFSLGRPPAFEEPWQLSLPTPGGANILTTTASASPLRINEWAASVDAGPDWLELYNPQAQPVALGGLFLTDRLTNRTKHEIHPFTFIGTGTNGYLRVIADGNPAQGPLHLSFSLDAGGESIGLFPPGTGPAIDTVSFGPQTGGVTEGRFPDGAITREFFNIPTPGAPNLSSHPNPNDTDTDGMDDSWERLHGFNVGLNDAALDSDSDGATNLQEFHAGTDPRDPASRLAIRFLTRTQNGVELAFPAEPGRTYTVLYKDNLQDASWHKLTDIPAQPTATLILAPDTRPLNTGSRFYRVITPAHY